MFRTQNRKDLPLHKRDNLGFSALDRIQIRALNKQLDFCKVMLAIARAKGDESKEDKLQKLYQLLFLKMLKLCMIKNVPKELKLIVTERINISDLETYSNFSSLVRFRSGDQLRMLLQKFQFPHGIIKIKSYRFLAEEIIIISLIR